MDGRGGKTKSKERHGQSSGARLSQRHGRTSGLRHCRPTDVRQTSVGRPTDVRQTSDGRPTDFRQTSVGRPSDVAAATPIEDITTLGVSLLRRRSNIFGEYLSDVRVVSGERVVPPHLKYKPFGIDVSLIRNGLSRFIIRRDL